MTLPARASRMARPLAAVGISLGLLCCAASPASAASAAAASHGASTAAASHGASTAAASHGASTAAASHGVGWLRLAHLSPNTPAVDVYLYSFGNSHAMIV